MISSDFLLEDDLYEMSNFNWRTTGLSSNIEVWCRTDPNDHGHSIYRLKIRKDREWAAIFTVGSEPLMVKDINNTISASEVSDITSWIMLYSSLLIGLIDSKIDTAEFAYELQKERNSDQKSN